MVGITNSYIKVDNINHSGQIVIGFWGRQSTGATAGSGGTPPSSNRMQYCDPDYFSVSDGVFTCKKAFTGKVYMWAISGRDSSGSSNTLALNIYKGTTSVLSGSTNNEYHSDGNGVSVSFAVNDTVKITGTHSHGGTHQCTMGFIVTL